MDKSPATPITVMDRVNQQNTESKGSLGMDGNDLCYATVPVDFFRYFDVDMGKTDAKTLDRLKDISGWVKSKNSEATTGELMQSLRDIERQLGSSHATEKRYDRVWNWLKMESNISEMRKRQRALERSSYV